ncbi:hypothetical protein GHT06_022517 [Daphnia sinensis]|uniref:DNA-directed RNA polymerase I subunit RPA49 n=1 Tax=Daphnia sinensis TaxID=1820382 RepID=A0AAD5PR69_9CRUS|nr:hypothetical protein GHT06_022517 [Daphnia sinensis]
MSFFIEEIKVASRGKKLEPVRIEFSHCQSPLNTDALAAVKSGIYSDSLDKEEYVTICQVEEQCYMGSTKVQNQRESQNLYIALRNKVTNKVKLVEVAKVILSPVVQYPPSTNPMLMENEEGNDKKSKEEMARAFVHRFGMLKGQRMYDQAERLTVKAETVRANLENAAFNAAFEDSELVLPKSSDSYEIMLPPRNANATTALEVYQLENMIPSSDIVALEETAKLLLVSENDSLMLIDSQFSVYFTDELTRVKRSNLDEEAKLRLLKALIYMEGLIKFSAIKKKTLSRGVVDESLPAVLPDSVKRSIKEQFSSRAESHWTLTKMDRDRTICHVIALALAIGNCSIDAESFISSLQLDMESVQSLIRVVGARLVKDKLMSISKIVLAFPLALPPIKRGRAKSKKESY